MKQFRDKELIIDIYNKYDKELILSIKYKDISDIIIKDEYNCIINENNE